MRTWNLFPISETVKVDKCLLTADQIKILCRKKLNLTVQIIKCVGVGEIALKPENCVYEKREDCLLRLHQQCCYSKGANVTITILLENTMLLS